MITAYLAKGLGRLKPCFFASMFTFLAADAAT